jgi:hypothetical protein
VADVAARDPRRFDPWEARPRECHGHHPLSPAGRVDQWGDLATGLRYNRPGRRRALRMLLALAVVSLVATGLVALVA